MASRAGFRNKERLRRLLKNLPETMRAPIKTALAEAAAEIVATQKQLVPVDTGALRNSIVATPGDRDAPAYAALRSRRATKDPGLAVIISAGNRAVRYAHIVEAHQPFFNPAFRAHRREAAAKIRRASRKAIKDAVKGRLAGTV